MGGSEYAHARNEKLKSYVNDRVDDINDLFDETTPVSDWICECSDADCTAPVTATSSDYDRIREHPRRFMILPGHRDAQVERLVEDRGAFLVVEKIGKAGEIAERERSRDGA